MVDFGIHLLKVIQLKRIRVYNYDFKVKIIQLNHFILKKILSLIKVMTFLDAIEKRSLFNETHTFRVFTDIYDVS